MRRVPEMRQNLKSLEEKNNLLAMMAKLATAAGAAAVASVPPQVDAAEAASDWESLVASLTAHEGHLDQQKEELAKQVISHCLERDVGREGERQFHCTQPGSCMHCVVAMSGHVL